MPARRINPYRVKLYRTYTVPELAECCGVHKNTVRHWKAKGLEPIDTCRPTLFQGQTVRAFLIQRKASRKRPCPPGTLYCFRCRQPHPPALGMVDYVAMTPVSGNLRALCDVCGAIMHRRTRKAQITTVMPGYAVQFSEGLPRLSGQNAPSLNCDSERDH